MENAIVIKGRLTGPRNVELDEPVSQMPERVEVTLRALASDTNGDTAAPASGIVELLRSLPPGTRSREDMDRQLRQDRDEWDRRGDGA